jgi:hypothetical protein
MVADLEWMEVVLGVHFVKKHSKHFLEMVVVVGHFLRVVVEVLLFLLY